MSISRDDLVNWVRNSVEILHENSEYLTELDAAIGDGDHGINMDRGFKAVLAKLPDFEVRTLVQS